MIRLVKVSDSKEILEMYTPYVRDTAISFETEIPTINEFSNRIEIISKQYPFLVYEIDNKVIGYAYASKHRERAAYSYNVDVSIYFLPEYHGTGKAYSLYDCLFKILSKLEYRNAYAAYTEPNIKSMKFHQKFDFKHIGTHHKTGYKFGKWYDVTWLEKTIKEHTENPREILSINEISHEYIKSLFNSNGIL